jgi:hypothetical protein
LLLSRHWSWPFGTLATGVTLIDWLLLNLGNHAKANQGLHLACHAQSHQHTAFLALHCTFV